jgi:hypothetical protein
MDERLWVRVCGRRPVAHSESTQELGRRLRDDIGDEDEHEDLQPAPENRRGKTQDEPENADTPELGERDEDLVQPLGAMQDDPPLEPVVEV